MDDTVLAQFQSTFLVSGEVHERWTPNQHHALYKNRGDRSGQEARRKDFLEQQKARRRDFADMARKIAEGGDFSEEEESEEEMEEGEVDEVDGKDARKRKKKSRYPYRKQLMLSEWLVDVPSDLEENWLMVVVPAGRRSLVVAARKTTNAYSRAGALLNNFPSVLPGGSRRSHRVNRDYCILDCIFYESSQTYYVMDVMCWMGHPVYDSDLTFRAFWKEQKLKECEGVSTYSRGNPLPFVHLPYHPCTRENLATILSESPPFEVDGLLFVHKECRYNLGKTPLCLWLKPQMVQDVLKVEVSQAFLDRSPIMESSKKKKSGDKMDEGNGEADKEEKTTDSKTAAASVTMETQVSS